MSARIRIAELRMQYPQTEFAIDKDEGGASTIYWNPKLGKRALIEILAALECLGAFLDENGKPASFASIVSNFERFLHVEFNRPYKTRTEILERKIRTTNFIDRMRHALLEKSEK